MELDRISLVTSDNAKKEILMSRLTIPALDNVPENSKPILDAVNKQLGIVPNMFRLFAKSPAALTGLTSLSGALGKTLDVKTRERIALAVAQVNGCDYCLSAHTYLGLNLAKISQEEVTLNRQGLSSDPKALAAVRFAAKVTETRGHISDADLTAVLDAGYTEAQVIEIVSLVAENVLTNFINIVAQTDIDFPVVQAIDLKTA
jgi:uncharacterized peroxidase-related enzyme